MTKNIIMLSL